MGNADWHPVIAPDDSYGYSLHLDLHRDSMPASSGRRMQSPWKGPALGWARGLRCFDDV